MEEKLKSLMVKISRNPYRGRVLKKVAEENDVTVQAIWNAANRDKNPRIIIRITEVVREIDEELKEAVEAAL